MRDEDRYVLVVDTCVRAGMPYSDAVDEGIKAVGRPVDTCDICGNTDEMTHVNSPTNVYARACTSHAFAALDRGWSILELDAPEPA